MPSQASKELVERPLADHMARLEQKIVVLKRELRNPSLADYERSEREISLLNAEEVLKLFRKAFELNRKPKYQIKQAIKSDTCTLG